MSRSVVPITLYPTEILDWTEEFALRLEDGESITGRAATAQTHDGTDTPGLISGAVGGTGSELTATFLASAGTPGGRYYIDLVATLSTSEKTVQRLDLSIPLP